MKPPLTIQNPCSENWESMKIGLHSRFCDNCQKNVIDFTNKDRREILEYLIEKPTEKVCGRIYRSQLDFSNEDFLVTIQALARQHKNTNLSFYLLTLGTMILAGCNNKIESRGATKKDNISIQSDSTSTQNDKSIVQIDSIVECAKNHNHKLPIINDDILLGEVSTYPFPNSEPFQIVEVMPEFKGGVDSLTSFISRNLKYPVWEREHKIEGKVFVNFVVDKNGKIKNPKIIHTVKGSKNLDIEVIRVIQSMPDWIPGQHNGKKVDVEFNLPINFKL
jgi:TonB family protein